MSTTRIAAALCLALAAFSTTNHRVTAQDHDWQPQPDRAAIMVISSHPDDEGIFFGGVLPYYTQVLQLPTVHLSMTSGDWSLAPEVREEELRNADWIYGLRNEPLFPRFRDYPTSTLDGTWDVWADGIMDGDDVQEGRDAAARYVAEQIRTFQPAVIVAHDIEGEYGHNNHRASSLAAIDAWALAADSNEDIAGLAAYQAQKLYVHQSEANGLGSPGYSFENWLFHDNFESITIDTDGDHTADSTPRQVADAGLDAHVTQGRPDVSTVYRDNENFNGHHSEWWGLLSSTVGQDSLTSPFEIEGTDYTDWARGSFLQNIDLSPFLPFPGIPGDVNLDGQVSGDGSGPFESDDVTAFVQGWGTTGHLTIEEKWTHGDMTLDGLTNVLDWHVLRTHHGDPSSIQDLGQLLANVPEPSGCLLLILGAAALIRVTPRSGRPGTGLGRAGKFHKSQNFSVSAGYFPVYDGGKLLLREPGP